jgi:hypothetical protein
MTSVSGGFNQVPANSLYINLVAVQSSIVDSNNNPVPWVVAYGALSTAGTVLFRDMGRTNVLPNPTTPTSVGGQSTLLRKVQLVTVGSAGGYFGTGNSSIAGAGTGTDFYTGYIRLGGFTFGGGSGIPSGFARLN